MSAIKKPIMKKNKDKEIITDRQLEIAEKYADVGMREHVLAKDMWTGPRTVVTTTNYCAKSVMPIEYEHRPISVSPALEKIFDEIIVNVLDHYQRNFNGKKSKVTYMKVNYSIIDGESTIRVENDGPGIEVEIHPVMKVYIPEVVSTMYLKGENLKKKDADITGGTNGLGMKLTNTYSQEFILETYDGINGKLYIQKSHNNMSVIDKPIITDVKKMQPHTTFTFNPDYVKLGYNKTCMGNKPFIGSQYEIDFITQIRTRLIMAKMYIRDLTITFNDEEIILNDINSLSYGIFGSNIEPLSTIIKDTSENGFHWEVCAVPLKSNDKTVTHFTIVNGVICSSDKSTCVQHLYTQITKKLETKITGAVKDKIKITKALVCSHLVLFINAKIPNNMISWDGQRKDECTITSSYVKPYIFNDTFLNKVCAVVKAAIISNIVEESGDWGDAGKKGKKDKYEKYTPAEYAGRKAKKAETRLLFPEGDSAEGMIRGGISHIGGFQYNGICNLGGNIINARKEIDIITQGAKQLKVLKQKLKNNELFKFIVSSDTGLTIGYNYDKKSPSYQKEMDGLKYGCFVVCVDQDLDGIGKIFSLFVNIFHLFWPNLLSQGYIKRFATPIIRIFRTQNKKQFDDLYDDYEYKDYCKEHSDEMTKYTTKYYKGLAGHEPVFVTYMFKHFNNNLFTYLPDDRTNQFFDIYFGKDSDDRKDILSTPVEVATIEEKQLYLETKEISLSYHLNFDTKSQKLSNIKQKLHDVIGGMNEAGRKIYFGLYDYFKQSNSEVKVAQLASSIALVSKYHHGEASLHNSLTQKGFLAIGGKQLPVILPFGQFGTRIKGGKDAGSPRYIFASFNKKLMNIIYPPADNFSLKYVYDEGAFIEPEYYIPIVPMVILESICMPADGWKIEVHARDLPEVIKMVKRLITLRRNSTDISKISLGKLKPYIDKRFKGKYVEVVNESYTVGNYIMDKNSNTVTITELPIGVWNDSYCSMLDKKLTNKLIEDYMDHSTAFDINIKIKVSSTFWENIESHATPHFDGIEEYFLLRDKMNSALNFIMPDGSVGSFTDYQSPVKVWFPFREQAYTDRYEHDIIMFELEILQLENEIKYSQASKELKIHEIKDVEAAEKILLSHKYIKINNSILNNPGTRKASELRFAILENPDDDKINYDYLLNINDRNKLTNAIETKIKRRNKLMNELLKLQSITIYDIWSDELDLLTQEYNSGIETSWGVDFDLDLDENGNVSNTKKKISVKKNNIKK